MFVSYDAAFSPGQIALIRKLNELPDKAFALVAARTPYDLLAVPEVPLYLCTYENKPTMMNALAGVLSGRLPARGVLPVTIGPYPRGSRT
ncbi:hypothetical protein [Paenibacillus sp. 32O-W]|uniref:hypothetical protein n=1 Tax=Paenibacillus sp. 32O-W TaxID=1695218 RepID=UPI0026C6C505